MRLRRSSPSSAGWTRRRSGTGFVYLDQHGDRITDPDQVQRLRDLVVPPAWRDVWLCPYPNGHLQAVGTDDAGRRQYLYHQQWQAERSHQKHDHVVEFARKLPAARERVNADLTRSGMPRERALAAAFRMLDLGLFRIGGETYAEEHGSYGLATLRKEHVRIHHGSASFEYTAKSGIRRTLAIADDGVVAVIQELKRRRGGGEELLAWREGRSWNDVAGADVNAYVKDMIGPQASAKDFRTWHATVLAAVALSGVPEPASPTAARRSVARAMRDVADQLGNTPTVCRTSYVDPRVIDLFQDGTTIRPGRRAPVSIADLDSPATSAAVERAVLRLLRS